jgi:membrane dipeptidase
VTMPADAGPDTLAFHQRSLVIDALGHAGPRTYSFEMLKRLDELIRQDMPYSRILDELDRIFERSLFGEDCSDYWQAWRDSGVDVTSVTLRSPDARSSYQSAIGGIARWTRRFDVFRDRLVKVTCADDAERAHRDRALGVILNFQNTTQFGADLSLLDQFYDFGVRVMQLTYNDRNLVGDGCTERTPSGLSRYGLDVVRRMNELGILIDVSHCSQPTALDAVSASRRPIAITHGFAKAVHEHDRGQSDAVIRAVGELGFVGVCVVPFFITNESRPTLDHFIRHVDHIVDLVGPDHVGIGTDWNGAHHPLLVSRSNAEQLTRGFRPEHRIDHGLTPQGFGSWTDWPNLTAALLEHGFSEQHVQGIIGLNFLRVFRAAVG